MNTYLKLLEKVILHGEEKQNRTGVPTLSLFGEQMRFDLREGFPLLTTKAIHVHSIIVELLWFISGNTNIKYLQDNKCRIWNEWADEKGDLGPIYGKQWRNWETSSKDAIDQLAQTIEMVKKNPGSRRLIVSAWNPSDLPDEWITPQENVALGKMALAACHTLFQLNVINGKLSCQLYARSQDIFLGTPFNIASYALLTYLIAQQCDLEAHELIWVGGDVHLYDNHKEQARLQLQRSPKELPQLLIKRKAPSIFEYKIDDFEILNYKPDSSIKAPVAI